MAVGDTTGDGKPRLVLLVGNPQQNDHSTLVVKKWNGTELVTEFTGAVQAASDKLAVGRFAGSNKHAVIVTADALWYWNGATYVRKPARKALSIFGSARMHSGEERLILSLSAAQFRSYAVNPEAPDEWLTDAAAAPTGSQVDFESMRAAPNFFNQMGMPEVLGGGGLITIWDASQANIPYLFYCRPVKEIDNTLSLRSLKINSYIAFRDATDPQGTELWKSPKLNGMATDMALEDARTPGKRGLLILTSSASPGMSRTVYFYGMD